MLALGAEILSKTSKGDADTLIKLYEMAMTGDNRKALMWWWNHPPVKTYADFKKKYPPDSEGYMNFVALGGFFEQLGVLAYYGLIHKEAVMDMYALLWEKSEPIVKGIQKERGRGVFENWEWLAKEKAKWLKTRPPKFPDEK